MEEALASDASEFRTSQMEEVTSRKATMEAAAAEGADVLGQLRALLAKHYMRVIDLLKQWDEDDSGDVDEKPRRTNRTTTIG